MACDGPHNGHQAAQQDPLDLWWDGDTGLPPAPSLIRCGTDPSRQAPAPHSLCCLPSWPTPLTTTTTNNNNKSCRVRKSLPKNLGVLLIVLGSQNLMDRVWLAGKGDRCRDVVCLKDGVLQTIFSFSQPAILSKHLAGQPLFLSRSQSLCSTDSWVLPLSFPLPLFWGNTHNKSDPNLNCVRYFHLCYLIWYNKEDLGVY